jgi:hypothetical protein
MKFRFFIISISIESFYCYFIFFLKHYQGNFFFDFLIFYAQIIKRESLIILYKKIQIYTIIYKYIYY